MEWDIDSSSNIMYYSHSTHHLDIIVYTLLYIGVLVGPDLGSSETRARARDPYPYPCCFVFSNPPASGPRAARPPLSQCDAKSRFC
jgi:hypothetical protein